MSIANFYELDKLKEKERIRHYFQHRFIFKGRTFSAIDIKGTKIDFSNIRKFLAGARLDENRSTSLSNSIFEMAAGYRDESEREDYEKRVAVLFDMFEMNAFGSFQVNLNYESYLQNCIDKNKSKGLFYVIDYMLETQYDPIFRNIIITDLPQLLGQDKVPIFKFLNSSYDGSLN